MQYFAHVSTLHSYLHNIIIIAYYYLYDLINPDHAMPQLMWPIRNNLNSSKVDLKKLSVYYVSCSLLVSTRQDEDS